MSSLAIAGFGGGGIAIQGFSGLVVIPPSFSMTYTLTSITYALVGMGADWVAPFTLVNGGPATISTVISDIDHASVTITANGNKGPYRVNDGTHTFVLPGIGTGSAQVVMTGVLTWG